ncbi:GSCOCT00014048001.2-RA-CDS [Cotesia congregata]|uniref:Venom protein 15 n=1 Tax=Cotesia congregata TaxID=51543 RepID=A0A8J2H877_COTCN|nr:GSCOCT00014048001.2-RA-CDS [Cotesia congregata]CAG5083995.1 Putative venom protein 15 [Cotesia congregata]
MKILSIFLVVLVIFAVAVNAKSKSEETTMPSPNIIL